MTRPQVGSDEEPEMTFFTFSKASVMESTMRGNKQNQQDGISK